MVVVDTPDLPSQSPGVVLVAQADQKQKAPGSREHVLGICNVVNIIGTGQADLFPAGNANSYFSIHTNKPGIAKLNESTAEIGIIQQPKHGKIEPNPDWADARYVPDDGYLGQDSFVLQVKGNGYTVKIHYFIVMTEDPGVKENDDPACKGQIWKISQSPEASGPTAIAALLDAIQRRSALAGLSGMTVSFANLVDTTVGQSC